jgi:hypothetical protein
VHQLFATVDELKQARTLQEWSETASPVVWFYCGDEEAEMESSYCPAKSGVAPDPENGTV